jgi:AcrR family transcriptional regulator
LGALAGHTMRTVVNRGGNTKEQLLDAAEQLFGLHGVANVSLRQIRIAADQKNQAAVQYHFGDRYGVIAALSERHTPQIQAIQDRFVAGFGEHPTPRQLFEAFCRPLAEYGHRGASERAWIKILAELLSDPQLSLETIREQASPKATDVGMQLYERLTVKMSPGLAGERIWAVAQFGIHTCADRARIKDDPNPARSLSSNELFEENLVYMALGALTAPAHSSNRRAPERR